MTSRPRQGLNPRGQGQSQRLDPQGQEQGHVMPNPKLFKRLSNQYKMSQKAMSYALSQICLLHLGYTVREHMVSQMCRM